MALDLSIIIVNWNAGSLLKKCLLSIAAAPPIVNHEVTVVDNASTDGSAEWLKSGEADALFAGGKFHTIHNPENVGFARANNQAIAYSDADAFFLLNPDTEVRAGAIDALLRALRSGERVGACGPRLLNPDGSLQPSAFRYPPFFVYTLIEGLHLYRLIPQPLRGKLLLGRHWPHTERRLVGGFSGAAIMVQRQAVDEVGAFDESFEMYGEEYEWYHRMRRGGWRLLFEPSAEVVHHGGQCAAQRWTESEARLRQIEASLRVQRVCLPPLHAFLNTLANLLIMSLMCFRRSVRGESITTLKGAIQLHCAQLQHILHDPPRSSRPLASVDTLKRCPARHQASLIRATGVSETPSKALSGPCSPPTGPWPAGLAEDRLSPAPSGEAE